MQTVHAFGGAVIVWRQAADPYVPATLKRTRGYSVLTQERLVNVGSTLSSAGGTEGTMTPAAGSSASSFSGTAIIAASVTPAGGSSSAAFAGLSTAAASMQADGASITSFAGSSIAAGSVIPAAGSSSVAFVGGDGSNITPAAGSSTVSFSGAAVAAAEMTPAAGSSVASFIGEAIEEGGGGTVDPAAVWNYTLSNGKTAQQTVVELHAMMSELYKIHGLAAGVPLVVDKLTRTAGDIEQSVEQVGDVVTVTRTG